jgi:hypothetical protein
MRRGALIGVIAGGLMGVVAMTISAPASARISHGLVPTAHQLCVDDAQALKSVAEHLPVGVPTSARATALRLAAKYERDSHCRATVNVPTGSRESSLAVGPAFFVSNPGGPGAVAAPHGTDSTTYAAIVPAPHRTDTTAYAVGFLVLMLAAAIGLFWWRKRQSASSKYT